MIASISAPELAAWLADTQRTPPVLLDVREAWELQTCALPNVQHMPMHTVPLHWQTLDTAQEIVCICHHGARSMQVALFLARQGFTQVINLHGGMDAWAHQVDATMATY